MSEDLGGEDLEREAEWGRRRDEWLASSEARLLRDLRPRPRRPADAAAGDALLARRPEAARSRCEALLHLEATYPRHLDFACVVALASQLLEGELTHLLLEPARPLAEPLSAALARKGKAKPADAVKGWGAGRYPGTIGTASLVLLALRYGLTEGDPALEAFLASEFTPPFGGMARDAAFGAALDEARERYRNPACHGGRTFSAADYAAFAALLVGRERVGDWAASGPAGGAALLHHLLATTRRPAQGPTPTAGPPATPAAKLLRLAASGAGWEVALSVSSAAGPPGRFRLGDAIRLTLGSARPCRAALVDIGTSGALTLLLPNPWQPAARLEAGVPASFPDPQAAPFDLTLAGAAGRERVVLIAWEEGLTFPLAVDAGGDFFELHGPEVDRLAGAAAGWPPGSWAARVLEFAVEAG